VKGGSESSDPKKGEIRLRLRRRFVVTLCGRGGRRNYGMKGLGGAKVRKGEHACKRFMTVD